MKVFLFGREGGLSRLMTLLRRAGDLGEQAITQPWVATFGKAVRSMSGETTKCQ